MARGLRGELDFTWQSLELSLNATNNQTEAVGRNRDGCHQYNLQQTRLFSLLTAIKDAQSFFIESSNLLSISRKFSTCKLVLAV